MQRRIARELVLEALYRMDLTGENPNVVIEEVLKRRTYTVAIAEFARRIVNEVFLHVDEIDRRLTKIIKNWKFSRLAAIDRAILRLGACELLYFKDVPFRVSINESIEIAKKYGDLDSSKFVNGVLDGLVKEKDE